ncbi:MAG: hypothetical protein U1G08_07365 [Verrucomicrobiota bacterium]
MIQETFGWKSLSMIGGLALYRFFFQIHPGSIKGPQVIEFLRHLQRLVPGNILTVIWDTAPLSTAAAWFRTTWPALMDAPGGTAAGLCPRTNPVEYMWGNLKTHQIGNLIATQAWDLSMQATAALRRMRRRPSIIAACYKQSTLWPE